MQLQCGGCDTIVAEDELLPFSCAQRGEGDVDHVLRWNADQIADAWSRRDASASRNPFVRYRRLSYSYQVARAQGLADEDYVDLVSSLSDAIAEVDRAPLMTPLTREDALQTWVKNETVNVSGSHKARHLIATAIHLALAERISGRAIAKPLAIASCGNAALAAAVVAKAAGRPLQVFVPPTADPAVLARLESLGAERVFCERRESDPAGDPCYLRFREAVAGGALPFSCQGGDNALALVGGHTLGWELIEQSQSRPFEDVFVQVGGGALASSLMQAYAMAQEAGLIDQLPRFHAVQTDNAHPLARAWRAVQERGADLDYARSHRSEFMWPWERPPQSVAGGILDDETYDWLSIVEGLHASHGSVITVSEDRLRQAQSLATERTGISVDHTGAAGFAGLLEARARGQLVGELGDAATTLVLFTGAIR